MSQEDHLHSEAHPQARMIGVYGMGGVGKTSLLRLVYDNYKKVSGTFDVVIWLTISQQYHIEKLQAFIAETLNLKLEGSSDNDLRRMKLSASLGENKFLLILDDMWSFRLAASACKSGNGIVGGGFPMLKSLMLHQLDRLESMVGSSVVSMLELQDIDIQFCRSLKRL
jgi:hypothetical protein